MGDRSPPGAAGPVHPGLAGAAPVPVPRQQQGQQPAAAGAVEVRRRGVAPVRVSVAVEKRSFGVLVVDVVKAFLAPPPTSPFSPSSRKKSVRKQSLLVTAVQSLETNNSNNNNNFGEEEEEDRVARKTPLGKHKETGYKRKKVKELLFPFPPLLKGRLFFGVCPSRPVYPLGGGRNFSVRLPSSSSSPPGAALDPAKEQEEQATAATAQRRSNKVL